jgi:hypothetical protein
MELVEVGALDDVPRGETAADRGLGVGEPALVEVDRAEVVPRQCVLGVERCRLLQVPLGGGGLAAPLEDRRRALVHADRVRLDGDLVQEEGRVVVPEPVPLHEHKGRGPEPGSGQQQQRLQESARARQLEQPGDEERDRDAGRVVEPLAEDRSDREQEVRGQEGEQQERRRGEERERVAPPELEAAGHHEQQRQCGGEEGRVEGVVDELEYLRPVVAREPERQERQHEPEAEDRGRGEHPGRGCRLVDRVHEVGDRLRLAGEPREHVLAQEQEQDQRRERYERQSRREGAELRPGKRRGHLPAADRDREHGQPGDPRNRALLRAERQEQQQAAGEAGSGPAPQEQERCRAPEAEREQLRPADHRRHDLAVDRMQAEDERAERCGPRLHGEPFQHRVDEGDRPQVEQQVRQVLGPGRVAAQRVPEREAQDRERPEQDVLLVRVGPVRRREIDVERLQLEDPRVRLARVMDAERDEPVVHREAVCERRGVGRERDEQDEWQPVHRSIGVRIDFTTW